MAGVPIERVLSLLKKATNSGKSVTNGPYTAEVDANHTRLRHYGTLIYHSEGRYSRRTKIVSLGGYSASDQAAIATAMYFDGIQGKVTRSAAVGKRMKGTPLDGWYVY